MFGRKGPHPTCKRAQRDRIIICKGPEQGYGKVTIPGQPRPNTRAGMSTNFLSTCGPAHVVTIPVLGGARLAEGDKLSPRNLCAEVHDGKEARRSWHPFATLYLEPGIDRVLTTLPTIRHWTSTVELSLPPPSHSAATETLTRTWWTDLNERLLDWASLPLGP